MPVVHRINKTKIVIYSNDHGIPHVHVIHPDFEAKLAIEDGSLIEGSAPQKVLQQSYSWIRRNRYTLYEIWNAAR